MTQAFIFQPKTGMQIAYPVPRGLLLEGTEKLQRLRSLWDASSGVGAGGALMKKHALAFVIQGVCAGGNLGPEKLSGAFPGRLGRLRRQARFRSVDVAAWAFAAFRMGFRRPSPTRRGGLRGRHGH